MFVETDASHLVGAFPHIVRQLGERQGVATFFALDVMSWGEGGGESRINCSSCRRDLALVVPARCGNYRHAWHRSLVPVPSGAEAAVPSTSCEELRSRERTLPFSLSTLSRQSEQCWSRCLKIRVQTKGQAKSGGSQGQACVVRRGRDTDGY